MINDSQRIATPSSPFWLFQPFKHFLKISNNKNKLISRWIKSTPLAIAFAMLFAPIGVIPQSIFVLKLHLKKTNYKYAMISMFFWW